MSHMPFTRLIARLARGFVYALAIAVGTAATAAPPPTSDEVWIGLAFSGGGHRATAFGYGLLRGLEGQHLEDGTALTDRVRFVAGVSGGSVVAAAFTLRGMPGLTSFRDDWLLTDVEARMTESLRLRDVLRGVNGPETLGRLLDENLFHGATFADLADRPAMLRILASDTVAAAPFVFDDITFGALCSDLSNIHIASAVTASAAVPVVFAQIPVARYAGCTWQEPAAYAAARQDENAHPAMQLLARTVASYTNAAEVRSVHLLDGSMAETYGTSGFLAARAEGGLSPMSNAEALRTRRVLFLAVDASHENWWITDRLIPTGRVLAMAAYSLTQRLQDVGRSVSDTLLSQRAITATMTDSYVTLHAALTEWRRQIIEWRCGLGREALDSMWPDRPSDWDCSDLVIAVGEVRLDHLPQPTRRAMNAVPTRLSLPPESIDLSIDAGAMALDLNPAWQVFRDLLEGSDP